MNMAARLQQGLTISEMRRAVSGLLREAGIDSAALDARILIGHALGLDHARLASQSDRVVSAEETAEISTLVARRQTHEPVARIVGEKEFWGLRFRLSPDTLIPRPETETLVEAALDFARKRLPSRTIRIADLGTGSGALLLALLHELQGAAGIGTDISMDATMTARANADRLGLSDRACFAVGNFGRALAGEFDLVLSNPPYIECGAIAALSAEVRNHDPHRALDGGPDGFDCYRTIAGDAKRLLAEGGALIVELGQGQCRSVTGLMAPYGLTPAGPARNDLSGIPRALTLIRAS